MSSMGTCRSTKPASTAARGIPACSAVATSWTMTLPPASWTARVPSAPSDPVPERTSYRRSVGFQFYSPAILMWRRSGMARG